jgi:peroxiredoxin
MEKTLRNGIFLILGTVLLCACGNKAKKTSQDLEQCTWQGQVNGTDADMLYLNYMLDGENLRDSVKITNGQFHYDGGSIAHPVYVEITVGEHYFWDYPVFLENGTLKLTIDVTETESDSKLTATGTPTNDEYYGKFVPLYIEIRKEWLAVSEAYEIAAETGGDTITLQRQNDELVHKLVDIQKKYVQNNPDSYVAAQYVFDNFSLFQHDGSLLDVYENLSDRIKQTPIGKQIEKVVNIFIKTKPGHMAIDIDLPNMEGNPIALSSLRGNYVLLDFWATWCGPCVGEFPKVRKLREKYHEKGFEIYGVSLDYSEKLWSDYLKKNGSSWINVLDIDEEAVNAYGIDAIPVKHLIDPEGKIALSFAKTEEIATYLEEHLK